MNTEERTALLQEALSHVGKVGLVRIVGAGLLFAVQVMLARTLNTENYGHYTFLWTIVVLSALFCRLGFDRLIVRYGAEYASSQRWKDFRALQYSSATIVAVLGGLALVIFTTLSLTLSGTAYSPSVFLAAGCLVALISVYRLREAFLNSLKRVGEGYAVNVIVRPMVLIVFLLGFWLAGRTLSLVGALLLTSAAALASAVVGNVRLQMHRRGVPFFMSLPFSDLTSWAKEAVPFLVYSGTGKLRQQSDRVILGLLGLPTQLGLFQAAVQLSGVVASGLSVSNRATAPMFAEQFTQGSTEEIEDLAFYVAALGTSLSLVIILFLVCTHDFVLGLFGPDFRRANVALFILLFGQGANAALGPVGTVAVNTDNQRWASRIESGALFLNVVLDLILIPLYGAEGAAIATTLTLLASNLSLVLLLRRRLNVNCSVFNPVRCKETVNLLHTYLRSENRD